MADNIKETYKECVGLLNQFFGMLYDEHCKPCVEENECGCCVGYNPTVINQIWETKIIEWAKKDGKHGEISDPNCPYLGKSGCRIPSIKPPVCASFFCNKNPDLTERYNNYYRREKHYLLSKYGIKYNANTIEAILFAVIEDRATEEQIAGFKSNVSSMIDIVKSAKARGN